MGSTPLQAVKLKTLLLILFLASPCFGGASQKYSYKDSKLNDEIENIYFCLTELKKGPALYKGAGAPAIRPRKIGDIYVSTTTSKVYTSTGTSTSADWAILN